MIKGKIIAGVIPLLMVSMALVSVTASSGVIWSIQEGSRGEPFTLELEAVIEGLSEEVSSSIDVHIEGGEE